MAIRIEKKIIAYESVTMTTFDPSYFKWDEDEIRRYLNENPMPEDETYSKEDLIFDLTRSGGTYMLPSDIKDETLYYIEGMLNKLINGGFYGKTCIRSKDGILSHT
jgi:hypothetical protein